MIQSAIFADGEKPRGKMFCIKPAEVVMQLDKDILHNVPGVFEIGREAKCIADERSLVALQDLSEGVGGVAHTGRFRGHHGLAQDFLGEIFANWADLAQNTPDWRLFCI